MLTQYMSDLHLEFRRGEQEKFVNSLPVTAPILVLAGDIFSVPKTSTLLSTTAKRTFGLFCKKWKYVVYVPGNHEYYAHSFGDVQRALGEAMSAYSNLECLSYGNPLVRCDGLKFVGSTLWFPNDPDTTMSDKRCMNDFAYIKQLEGWVYEENSKSVELLWRLIDRDTVVVTHHLPSPQSVHPRYAGSRLNRFFVCDLTTLIEELQPKLWIHGHTHERICYSIKDTRVRANPLGYPHEPTDFNAAATEEV